MMIKFGTKYGQLLMQGEPALALVRLGGHSGTVPGAVLANDLPGFLQRLRAGLELHGDQYSPAPLPREPVRRGRRGTRASGRSGCGCAPCRCWT